MSLRFLSHVWDVQDVEDGTLVELNIFDLSESTTRVLAEELSNLVQESGRSNLYIDLSAVPEVAPEVLDQLVDLHGRVHAHGGRLELFGLSARIRDALERTPGAAVLDVHAIPLPTVGGVRISVR